VLADQAKGDQQGEDYALFPTAMSAGRFFYYGTPPTK